MRTMIECQNFRESLFEIGLYGVWVDMHGAGSLIEQWRVLEQLHGGLTACEGRWPEREYSALAGSG